MPKVVLHYFDVRALGEGPRMLLAYGGQEFEDRRLSWDEWLKIKPKMPFGVMPVLEWDGKLYSQSIAISRYLGRKFGLAGNDIEEEFEIDQNMDFYIELRTEAVNIYYDSDENSKARKQEEAEKDMFPRMLQKFEEIAAKNNGHIALGRLTWGDFVIAGSHDYLKRVLQMPDVYEKYPNLKRIYENVITIPQVKAYIDAAPKNAF